LECKAGAVVSIEKLSGQNPAEQGSFQERLPREICGRTEEQMNVYEQICLHISGEVERLMEDRGILREDVQKAIYHAETTGAKFSNPSTGRFLTSHRPDRVTYWVEYSQAGEDYQVHVAYSHRMEMKRGRG
jgi:glutamate synthase (NADPH) small chain